MAMTEKEVKKRTVLYEMEDELWRLVKRRVWIFVITFAVIGASGIWAIVHFTVQQVADRPLKDLQKQLVNADVQVEGAKTAATASRKAADEATMSLAALQASIQGLRDQAKAVENQFTLVSQQINAASENAARRSQQDFNAVQQRIAGLEALVKKIGEENDATRKATADYAKQVAALETRVEREQKRFAENSGYTVSIFFDPSKKALATELQSRLAALGFRAPVHEVRALKGNSLTYQSQSDVKAQEVLALLKPVVKDVQVKKFSELGLTKELAEIFPGVERYKSPLIGWHVDPKSMQLALGVN